MTHILHRQIGGTLPVAAGGRGIEIVDSTGKRYLDASGGAAVSCLGYGHPDVRSTPCGEQLDALAYAHTAFFTTEVVERLADRLIEDAPPGLEPSVYLLSGGWEAIEAALEIGASVFCRDRWASTPPCHCAAPELSREHTWRACRRRQRLAQDPIRALADRDPSHRPPATPIGCSEKDESDADYGRREPPRRWRISSYEIGPDPQSSLS